MDRAQLVIVGSEQALGPAFKAMELIYGVNKAKSKEENERLMEDIIGELNCMIILIRPEIKSYGPLAEP